MEYAQDAQSDDPLLAPDEPRPFELIEHAGDRPIIFVCDHAGDRIPRSLGTLGLGRADLDRHIALDLGAAAVARRLAAHFEASAVLGVYSRLVVDTNRALEDVTAFPEISDGIRIPGNANLSRDEKSRRARALYKPYHEAIRALVHRKTRGDTVPVFIAVHSFTPHMNGFDRPWHVGVLWDKDPRLALPLMAALRADRSIVVGDNEPYSGRHPADFTIDHHAEATGLAHTGIELRQDLLATEEGRDQWAARLGDALEAILEDPSLYRLREPMRSEAAR